MTMTDPGKPATVYEQPLNERVRTFLRLEFLFTQYRHHREDPTPWGTRAALRTLLDLFTVVGRGDLKTEVLKDLTEQKNSLVALQQRPGVDPARLDSVLKELDRALSTLQALTTHALMSVLRDNEFLISLLHRSTVPGGASAFDLPGYHHWLSQPRERIRQDLDAWFADLGPFEQAITLFLRLLRHSTEPVPEVAKGGMFVYTPQGRYYLVRVLVDADAGVFPEISAGRHRFTVRFMTCPDPNTRPVQAAADVPFRLQCCAL
jgi:cell division protein ZapD